MGRPSLYTPEVVEEICQRLSMGEPLEEICRDDHMPASRTVHGWLLGQIKSVPEDIVADIARARETGYDVIAINTRRVARGDPAHSSGDIQRDKLIVDTDLKLLSKWSKKYGDKKEVELKHSGEIGVITGSAEATQLLIEKLERERGDRAQENPVQE